MKACHCCILFFHSTARMVAWYSHVFYCTLQVSILILLWSSSYFLSKMTASAMSTLSLLRLSVHISLPLFLFPSLGRHSWLAFLSLSRGMSREPPASSKRSLRSPVSQIQFTDTPTVSHHDLLASGKGLGWSSTFGVSQQRRWHPVVFFYLIFQFSGSQN